MEEIKIINKLKLLSMLSDPEQVFLVEKEGAELYLIADLEVVDEFIGLPTIRTEKMCFNMKNNVSFLSEAVDCRARYCGGIYINDNIGKSSDEIFVEFVNIEECAQFLCCNDDRVDNIAEKLTPGMNYLLIY